MSKVEENEEAPRHWWSWESGVGEGGQGASWNSQLQGPRIRQWGSKLEQVCLRGYCLGIPPGKSWLIILSNLFLGCLWGGLRFGWRSDFVRGIKSSKTKEESFTELSSIGRKDGFADKDMKYL